MTKDSKFDEWPTRKSGETLPQETPSLFQAIVEGDVEAAISQVQVMLDANQAPSDILENILVPAMGEVGRLFDEGEYFVPDLMVAAEAMREATQVLAPKLKSDGMGKLGTIIFGTVAGDHHDIGKNLVISMLEGNGFEVIDLGVNTPIEKFVEAVQSREGNLIVAMSALLTITMPQMKMVIDRFTELGLRDRVKFMIGGAPVTESFAREIGADGYSDGANSAVTLAKTLV